MIISGLLKTTLLDYPQHVAATIFLGGCNFRCPFCHNSDLLEGMDGLFSKEEVLTFLKKRAGILEGVCITGGEPTLHRDLEPVPPPFTKEHIQGFPMLTAPLYHGSTPTDTGRMY